MIMNSGTIRTYIEQANTESDGSVVKLFHTGLNFYIPRLGWFKEVSLVDEERDDVFSVSSKVSYAFTHNGTRFEVEFTLDSWDSAKDAYVSVWEIEEYTEVVTKRRRKV